MGGTSEFAGTKRRLQYAGMSSHGGLPPLVGTSTYDSQESAPKMRCNLLIFNRLSFAKFDVEHQNQVGKHPTRVRTHDEAGKNRLWHPSRKVRKHDEVGKSTGITLRPLASAACRTCQCATPRTRDVPQPRPPSPLPNCFENHQVCLPNRSIDVTALPLLE